MSERERERESARTRERASDREERDREYIMCMNELFHIYKCVTSHI